MLAYVRGVDSFSKDELIADLTDALDTIPLFIAKTGKFSDGIS